MKHHILTACTLVAVLGICLLAGCSSSASAVNLADDGYAEAKDSELTVTLKGNPTTGYVWNYRINGENVECTLSDYAQDKANEGMAGAGGTYTFKFKATGATEATVQFTYARAWEKTEWDRTCSVTISANNSGKIVTLTGTD